MTSEISCQCTFKYIVYWNEIPDENVRECFLKAMKSLNYTTSEEAVKAVKDG